MIEDDLYKAVITVINNAVGPQLSTYGTGVSAGPAIFKDSVANKIGKALYGLRPYVRVVMGIVTPSGAHRNESWYDSDGNKVTQTILNVDCTVQVVGGNATDICRKIQQHLVLSEFSHKTMYEYGISVPDAEPVRTRTTYFNNEGFDSAFFIATLTTTDELVEPVYEMLTVDSTLDLRYPNEDNIVSENVTIP